MSNIVLATNRIPSMEDKDIAKVQQLIDYIEELPQVTLETSHIIHGGIYSRTIKIPAGVVVGGALIKIATTVIIQGDAAFFIGDKAVELHGYNIFAASAGRKQACLALSDVYATMMFPTKAKTVEEAEQEFTDEVDLLMVNSSEFNTIMITGE